MRCLMLMADYSVPTYLKAFDLNADQGRGKIEVTTDIADAMRFDNGHEVLAAWRSPSSAVPTRTDGKPNRPLSAFSIEIVPAPEDEPEDEERQQRSAICL